jgi:glycosyltransferase involved in cell wall biosynthesis
MTVRDEMLRLRQNLAHHRSIGVRRFFVVDNGSTDGSGEFLLAQPDCHVFLTRNSYADSHYGLEWQQTLLDEYGTNHWCLVVDADEWFIYPGYERKPLPDLAAYLDRYDAQGIFSFLLDMYGPGTIAEAVATPRRSPLDAILTVSISGAAGCAFLAYSAALPRIQRHRRPEMAPVFCVLASILLSAADHLAHE